MAYGAVEVPSVDRKTARLRIEVMQSWEINVVVFGLYTAILVGILYSFGFVELARAWWFDKQGALDLVLQAEQYAILVVELIAVFAAVAYIIQILCLERKQRLDEQIWTCLLLSVAFFAENPFAVGSVEKPVGSGERGSPAAWKFCLDDAMYASVTYFYFLSMVHSYRILDKSRKSSERFYVPKVVATLIYLVVKTSMAYYAGLRLGFVPFTRVVGMLILEASGRHSAKMICAVLVTTLMDFYLIAWIMKEIAKTGTFLSRQRYVETRTKQLGFRSFVYLNVCFGLSIMLGSLILVVGLPRDYYREVYDEPTSFIQVSSRIGDLGLVLMYETWALITAYLNLPAAGGFSFRRSDDESAPLDTATADGTQVLQYRHREWHTDEHDPSTPLAMRKNVFVMQTQIQMINCAWVAYIPGNPKEEKTDTNSPLYKGRRRVRVDEVMEESKLKLINYVCDSMTDAHMLIFEDRDRVVVSFSGTRGYRNWIHNIEVYRTRWSELFGQFVDEDASELADLDNREDPLLVAIAKELIHFGEEKVHSGFARIYKRLRPQLMRTLMNLYDESYRLDYENHRATWRPIFFTGHSLGGALATLASFDTAVNYYKIGVRSAGDVSCTTFGCPRVGNAAFQRLYDRTISHNWRFVVASDVVTKMPRFTNYTHVGIQVLLTHQGNLLVDPSFIELNWWHHLHTSHKYHSRFCYFLALKLWCKRYNGGEDDLRDEFWPLPDNPSARGLIAEPPEENDD